MEIIRSAHLGSQVVGQLSEALVSAAALVDELPQRSLGQATPCRGWSVLDVISHLAAVTEKFGRFAAGTAGPVHQQPGDLVGTQPAKSFRDIAEAAVITWREHPGALTAVCVLPFGSAAASAISVEQRTHLFNLNRARRCPKSLGRDVYIAERSVRSGEMCAGRTQQ